MALCAELLDAHADTIGLAAGRPLGERWEAHLDYLRALQRVGYAIQARTCRQEAS